MANILCKTMHNENPNGKPRVFFTCHPEDFGRYFERICKSIFKTHDCAIYYTEDMREPIPEQDLDTDLGSNNLLVIPVTRKLLTEPNRAMDKDFPYALRAGMPVLPIMMEPGLDALYSKPEKFDTLQYLSACSADSTAISYEEKLRKFLESVLISDEMAKRIRAAFDAYIFLSYRKKDRRYANELMRMIHRNPQCRDIAIWYDEFLTPGESFQESIDRILHNSKLFALLVTPNLLEEPDGNPNFVMAKEYPAAKASGIKILPAEMEPTDRAALSEKYQDIPQCVPADDDAAFQKALTAAIQKIAITTNDTDPEHTFLMGLAYLEGIDVEVDRQRSMELITVAAENQLPEAMKKLSQMYSPRPHTKDDRYKALNWAERYWEYHTQTYGQKHPDTLAAMYFTVQILDAGHFKDEAVHLCQKVYALRCEILGEDHYDTLETLLYLADMLVRSQPEKAVELYEKANSPLAAYWGPESYKFCVFLRSKAEAYKKLGNDQKALDLYDQIFALRCNVADKDDTIAVDALNRMAQIYEELGDQRNVLALREKAHDHQCKILGEENPEILRSLDALADTYKAQGKHRDAIELYKKAYTLRCRAFGEDSENVLRYLEHLYWNLGYRDADKLREKIDALTEKKNKKREAERIEKARREQEAERIEKARREQEAERVDNTADKWAAKPAPSDPSVSSPTKKSYEQEKLERLQLEYAVWSKYVGDEDTKTRELMAQLTWFYDRTGNTREAIALYKKAYSIHEKLGNHQVAQALKERVDILQRRSAGIPEKVKRNNNIYLVPCGDRAYWAAIWEKPLEGGALFLSKEGSYPVKVTWTRLDLNCDTVWEEYTCEDDMDLIALLDSLGTRGCWIEDLEFLGTDDTVADMDFCGADVFTPVHMISFEADSERLAFVDYLRTGGYTFQELPSSGLDGHTTVSLAVFDADRYLLESLDYLRGAGHKIEVEYGELGPAFDEDGEHTCADGNTEDLPGYGGGEGAYHTCEELFDDCYGRQKEENMAAMIEIDDDCVDGWLYGNIYDT